MAYRIVKINSRCKLETQLNYLVCRSDKETKILLDDIEMLIIENQQVCITEALITELIKHKVRIMFCDEKHNPEAEAVPYASCYDSSAKVKQQFKWNKDNAGLVWANITKQKIINQAWVLNKVGITGYADVLTGYALAVEKDDSTNREGLAAKTYFLHLYGTGFDRRDDKDIRNAYLNYGYSLLLSAVNREISSFGYLNQVGIHHIGETNPFNLGCDMVEPLRPFADFLAIAGKLDADNYKTKMMNLLSAEVSCNSRKMLLQNAIHEYVISVLSALNSQNPSSVYQITFQDE